MELLEQLSKLHTTTLGKERIRRNLKIQVEDVVGWCRQQINRPEATIVRKGKNWYVSVEHAIITVNAYSMTIITAHKEK